MDKKIIVFGTRPEFIKLLPLIWEISRLGIGHEYYFLFSGQHNQLVKDLFTQFGFTPDESISFVDHNNSLPDSFIHLLSALQKSIDRLKLDHEPVMMIGQGDTTSCLCAAFCAYLNRIPFTHIEGGLRTNTLEHPWPEEYFRKIISLSSTTHFVPTDSAKENLIREGIAPQNIHVTGNTIVDVIHHFKSTTADIQIQEKKNKILISCHRRENQRINFETLAGKVIELARINREYQFIWLTHPNIAHFPGKGIELMLKEKNISVSPPVSFTELYSIYSCVKMIISDSGGVQEEAPSFNIPVIVIREHTERMESVKLGYSATVSDIESELIPQFNKFMKMQAGGMQNPFGDGNAAVRIISHLQQGQPSGLR
jgi:UDP-N-acetylglucosamine 2-epimerase (non-hydrolysing)